MYEFYEKNYLEAISCYKKAEAKLHKLTDEIEKAEFYYNISYCLLPNTIISDR